MTDLPALLARLGRGDLDEQCRTITAIGQLGAAAGPAIPRLLAQFDSHAIRGPGSTAFGPTGNDPGRDFPLALAAVDALAAIGEPAHAPILEILERAGWNHRRYHAMLTAGRLRLADAVPHLEATIAAQDEISVRVNFDQCEDYPLHVAALAALREIDPARAWAALDRLIRARARARTWALHSLAAAPDAADTIDRLLADDVLSAAERTIVTTRVAAPAIS